MEEIPIAVVTVGKSVEIAFTSAQGLDSNDYEKVGSILEKHKYNSDKLELMCEERDDPGHKYDTGGRVILDCSLKCGSIDPETESEIRNFLKNIPYVKI